MKSPSAGSSFRMLSSTRRALPRKAPPLVIGEPQPAPAQLLTEDAILFDETVDDDLLAAVDHPTRSQSRNCNGAADIGANSTLEGMGGATWAVGPTSRHPGFFEDPFWHM